MKVSIITVCFNSASTLEATVLSVKQQSYQDIEYIVIDGSSSDETINIIKSNRGTISKWISEPDTGLYDAMNKGINLSTGDLIGILNSDDIFYSSDVIKNVVDFHSKNIIQASVGDIIQISKNRSIVRFYSSSNWSPPKLSKGYMPPHPSIFFKKELFDKFGLYDTSFKIASDYELITRYFIRNSIIWKYSGILTTSMLIGGASSSGLSSYCLISKEIRRALEKNKVRYSYLVVQLRFIWKIVGVVNAKISLKRKL